MVAFIRSATAMDQEASTKKRTRFATRLTRTLRCRSLFSMAKARRFRFSTRRFWKGAAARSVASKAMSSVLLPAGRALMYRPCLRSVLVRERRPACLRLNLSSGVLSLRGWKVSPVFTFCPPSHQFALVLANASWRLGSGCPCWGPSSASSSSFKFFFPRACPAGTRTSLPRPRLAWTAPPVARCAPATARWSSRPAGRECV